MMPEGGMQAANTTQHGQHDTEGVADGTRRSPERTQHKQHRHSIITGQEPELAGSTNPMCMVDSSICIGPPSKRLKPSSPCHQPVEPPEATITPSHGNCSERFNRSTSGKQSASQKFDHAPEFDEEELLEMALEAEGHEAVAPALSLSISYSRRNPPGFNSGPGFTSSRPAFISSRNQHQRPPDEDFDEEELLEMAFGAEEDHYNQLVDTHPGNTAPGGKTPSQVAPPDDVDLDEELEHMLAEQQIRMDPSQGPPTRFRSTAASIPAQPAPAPAPAPAPPPPPDTVELMIREVRARYSAPALDAADVSGDCMTITDVSGRRVYCGVLPAHELDGAVGPGATTRATGRSRWKWMPRSGSLLSRPLSELMAAAEDAQVEAAVAESKRLKAATDAQLRRLEKLEQQLDQPTTTPEIEVHENTDSSKTCGPLWVDKYAPRSFLHLLSDDWTNREVLKWMKAWDRTVFGSGSGHSKTHMAVVGTSEHLQPEQPTILMCGPPGLGKTTLAHVIAEHCGYRPLEINASDDRNSDSLLRKVQDAAEMRAILGGPRPNCVIIDEIDGAMGGSEGSSAISALVKLLQGAGKGKPAGKGEDTDPTSGKGRKKKKSNKALGRPVICICNDLYAPALRPLRGVARIFHFQAPTVDKLVARLTDICQREGIKADRGALSALATKTECDIRACLNTLQFLARQGTCRIRLKDVNSIAVGQKDINKSAYTIWSELLYGVPYKGSAVKEMEPAKIKRLFGLLENHGDYELAMMGVMDNLLTTRYMDTDFKRTATMINRLADADCFIRACRSRGMDMSLQKYVPACLLSLRLTMACHERGHLQWPRSQSECSQRLKVNQEVLHTWFMRMTPCVARWFRARAAAQDLIPAFQLLTRPRIQAMAPHLLQPIERDLLLHLSQIMWAYGLTFTFPAAQLNNFAPKEDEQERPCPLLPALDTLHAYAGLPRPAGMVMSEELRRLVAQNVELASIRKAEEARLHKNIAIQVAEAMDMDGNEAQEAAHQPEALGTGAMDIDVAAQQSGEAAAVASPASTCGAPVGPSASNPKKSRHWLVAIRHAKPQAEASKQKAASTPADEAAETAAAPANAAKCKPPPFAGFSSSRGLGGKKMGGGHRRPKPQLPVLYKFNEGYTNAVKRPLKMSDLL